MQYLNAELKGNSVNADITSVNPDLRDSRFRRDILWSNGYDGKTIAAIGQQLSFKNESFDRVLSLGAMTVYAGPDVAPETSVQAWMTEVVRVLKKGGIAKLGPVYGEEVLPEYNSLFEAMNLNASLVIEPVINSSGEQLETTTKPVQNLYRLVITK